MDLYFWLTYHQVVLFAFGGLASQSLTDIAKYSIGRLRPHFLSVCSPSSNPCEGKDMHQYIEDYTCPEEKNIRDSRLSFMSGHSSFAAYSAVYMTVSIISYNTQDSLTSDLLQKLYSLPPIIFIFHF